MLRTLLICSSLALGACATHAAAPTPAAPTVAKNGAAKPPCLMSASRIPDGGCNAAGRTYTQQDLDRTGQTNVGQALQMLDPSITVGH